MKPPLRRERYPLVVMLHALRLQRGLGLSLRETATMMQSRGISVSHESLRNWATRFQDDVGSIRPEDLSAAWRLEHRITSLNGMAVHLWSAHGRDGEVLELLVQASPSASTARRRLQGLTGEQLDRLRAASAGLRP